MRQEVTPPEAQDVNPRRKCKALESRDSNHCSVCNILSLTYRQGVFHFVQAGSGATHARNLLVVTCWVLQQCRVGWGTFNMSHKAHLNRQKASRAPTGKVLLVSSGDVTCNAEIVRRANRMGLVITHTQAYYDELDGGIYCQQTCQFPVQPVPEPDEV